MELVLIFPLSLRNYSHPAAVDGLGRLSNRDCMHNPIIIKFNLLNTIMVANAIPWSRESTGCDILGLGDLCSNSYNAKQLFPTIQ
jgi:hypothetical protein